MGAKGCPILDGRQPHLQLFMLVLFGAAFRSIFLPEGNEEEIYSSDGPMYKAIGEVKLSKRR